eukprot:CAMPEP_0206146122 /NCGR_PEP_ID=MMETSP1473-20131121/29488_1 /ASSEMBLY_ACC=CAM_ASM_001109 /TAXON_ID=1461547 /ORGANISM="Stichococcus sp, Strain RCC1054" /LENGTH=585 /DNA_ID=CAMNT_0053542573 /DNA_START=393 /DNA_END=2146 /DNA_ORIENTATION=+
MIEILADGSVRWRLSDVAAEEMQLIVPRAAMTRVGVRYETECTVQLQGGLTFESKLLPVVETRGGRLSIRWPEMRDALKLRGGETVRLWEGHSGTKLQLILHVTAPLQPQVKAGHTPATTGAASEASPATPAALPGPVIDGQPVGEGAIPTNELQNGPTLHPGLPAGSSLADAAATEAIDIPSVMPNSTANGIPACLPPQPPPQSLIQPPPQPSLQSPLQQAPAAALEHAPSVQHAPSPQQVAPSPVHYYAHGGPLRGAATAQPDGSYQWRMPQSSSIRLHLPKAVASAWRVQDRALCQLVLPSGRMEELSILQQQGTFCFSQGWKRIWDSEGFQAGQMLNVMAVPGSRNLLRLALRIVAGPGLADPLPQPITPPTPDTLPSPAPVHMSPAATLQHPAPEHNNSSASPHPAANMQPVFENKSSTAAVTAVSDAEGVLVVPAGMSTVTGTGAGTAAAMAPSRMQLPARKPAVRPGPVAPQQDGSFQWRLPAVVPQRLQLPTLVAASLSIQHGQVCRLTMPSGRTADIPLSKTGRSSHFSQGWPPVCEAEGLQAGQLLSVKAEPGSSPLQLTLRVVPEYPGMAGGAS